MEKLNRHIVQFCVINRLSGITVLTEKLKKFCTQARLNKADSHDIILVLEEWFTNLIKHGYQNTQVDEVAITIEDRHSLILITVSDEGVYFDPIEFSLPDLKKPLGQRKPGGVGLHLILNLMDKVSYKRENNKNVLRLEKRRTE